MRRFGAKHLPPDQINPPTGPLWRMRAGRSVQTKPSKISIRPRERASVLDCGSRPCPATAGYRFPKDMAKQDEPRWLAKDFQKFMPFHHLSLFNATGAPPSSLSRRGAAKTEAQGNVPGISPQTR